MSEVVDVHMKNGKRPDFDVYIGRAIRYHKEFVKDSIWANRSSSLKAYEMWVRHYGPVWNRLEELEGKVLGCWCKPKPCHGDVLAKLAEEIDG